MKATLIIKNIENLYTCDAHFTILHQAFLAIHHDQIIDFGTHSFKKWLDPATVVIDSCGECVLPAFIDCNYEGFHHVRLGDQLRQDGSALFAMKMNGILTLLTNQKSLLRHELTQDVFLKKIHRMCLLLNREKCLKKHIKNFVYLVALVVPIAMCIVFSHWPINCLIV